MVPVVNCAAAALTGPGADLHQGCGITAMAAISLPVLSADIWCIVLVPRSFIPFAKAYEECKVSSNHVSNRPCSQPQAPAQAQLSHNLFAPLFCMNGVM